MGVKRQLEDGFDEVDVIIAGGGTAGCIVASRLAMADPTLHILVVETGPDNYHDPAIMNLLFFFGHIVPDSKNTLWYHSRTSNHLGDRAVSIPAGGTLGGGSSINMACYSRPQKSDYDDWNMPGWSADDLLPIMRKFENFHGKGDPSIHGDSGPVHVSDGGYRATRAENAMIEAAKKAGWREVEDAQNMVTVNGIARANRYVSQDGVRQDTAHQYLHPLLSDPQKYPNLHVVVESQVLRVLVENGKATGIVLKANLAFQPGDNLERIVKARRAVVISCGALGTPLLLERSGIGNPDILSKAGISTVVANAGVGADFEDHQLITYAYRTNLDVEKDTINFLPFGKSDPEALLSTKDERLGYNGQDVTIKIRPTDAEAAQLGPAFEDAWKKYFANKPDRPIVGLSALNCFPGLPPEGIPYDAYLGMSCFSVCPFSRGHIHITGPTIDDAYDFDTGYLADPDGLDVKKHIWAYKKQREIMRRMECFRGEVPEWNPRFASDSPAALVAIENALPDGVEDIIYSSEDDAAIEAFVRANVGTTWHCMGTCKMKAQEDGGVVDGRLNVYGVKGLKIADMSIAPGNVAANTNNTALMIGEKAAEFLIQDLKLNVSS